MTAILGDKLYRLVKENKLPSYYMHKDEEHIDKLLGWLALSMDMSPSEGLSLGYNMKADWLPQSELITASVIRVFIRTKIPFFLDRARSLSDYLLSRQVPMGWYFPASKKPPVTPTIFTTGEIISGLLEAYLEYNDEEYLLSAIEAADWLLSVQASDGTWRRFSPNMRPQAFHALTASRLILLSVITAEDRFKEAALRFASWLESMYEPKMTWFWHLERDGGKPANTVDIARAILGMTRIGLDLGRDKIRAQATDLADKILTVYRNDAMLFPCYTSGWKAGDKGYVDILSCALMAEAFLELDKARLGIAFGGASRSLIQYLKSTHVFEGSPVIEGGMKASQPVYKGIKPLTFSTETGIAFAHVLQEAIIYLLPKWDKAPEKV